MLESFCPYASSFAHAFQAGDLRILLWPLVERPEQTARSDSLKVQVPKYEVSTHNHHYNIPIMWKP